VFREVLLDHPPDVLPELVVALDAVDRLAERLDDLPEGLVGDADDAGPLDSGCSRIASSTSPGPTR
jgi:hypothetical protein